MISTKINQILRKLRKHIPNPRVELDYETPIQLLVATILSAQCTDKRVNLVTPALFKKYPTVEAFASARITDLERSVKSTGFYRNKAKFIKASAQKIVKEYDGKVPDTMAELLTLPGVARKTANCVLGAVYNKNEGIVVDTHVSRVSQRLGLTNAKSPVAIERALMAQVPQKNWYEFSSLIVLHGRYTCLARKPKCMECPLNDICPSMKRFYPE